ncbi:MAG: FHA domain-containing protein [Bdellovibrionaceae bacterium]|nr:FHA domain-containing protein [Pseudobdellovibrionaceae bacterium]
MWSIQFLNGPLKGKHIQINDQDIVGRSKQCNIHIPHNSVSKKHCRFYLQDNQLYIEDLNSSNGSFINGKKITNSPIENGAQLNLHDLQAIITSGEKIVNFQSPSNIETKIENNTKFSSVKEFLNNKIETALLPGIYKLPELLDFRYVLGLLLISFVLIMTSLSYIPLGTLLQSSIQKESQNRALGIAKHLATLNKVYLQKGPKAAISTSVALQEPGVDQAFIISAENNRIIAPLSEQGQYPPENINNLFIGIDKNNEYFKQLDSSTIIAIKPIQFLSRSAELKTLAYAVIIYNMGSLSFSDGRALSLFIQTLFIGLLIGSILFFFLFKIISYIFNQLNVQIQSSLEKNQGTVNIPYQFSALQKCIEQINNILNRIVLLKEQENAESSAPATHYDKFEEVNKVTQLIGYPSLILDYKSHKVISTNLQADQLFEESILHQEVENLVDQSLKLNLQDLLERSKHESNVSGFIELQDYTYNIELQLLFGLKSIDYALLVFTPKE